MGKRTAKVPLALISPNESVYGTRSKSGGASTFGQCEGKGSTPVRSSRRGIQIATADGLQTETSRSSNERGPTSTSQKRSRSSTSTVPSTRSKSRGEDKGLRTEEDGIAGSQSSASALVRKDENILPDNNMMIRNRQITAIADEDCSPSNDSLQSRRARQDAAVQDDPDFSGNPDERLVACSPEEQNMVSVEVVRVTNMAPLALVQSSPTESRREDSSGKKRALTRTYRRRKASRDGIIGQCAPNPQEVLETSKNEMRHPSQSDKNHSIESTAVCKSDDLQAKLSGATYTLQNAYDMLFKKYQNLKVIHPPAQSSITENAFPDSVFQDLKKRQLADAEEAMDEQSERIKRFSTVDSELHATLACQCISLNIHLIPLKAADDLVQNLKTTKNSVWEYQEEMMKRSRLMEAAYTECQNDLVIERARNLELRQQLESAELRGSKLLHELLQNATQLTISNYGKSEIMFSHDESGYEFKLEQNKLAEEVGGKDALLYNAVSPGTILHVAPEWMRSEIVFDMAQVQVFFRRILAVALRGGISV